MTERGLWATRGAATAVVGLLYLAARPTELPESEAAAMSARFRFRRADLPVTATPSGRALRGVNPSLRGIRAWVSAEGGAIALHDLDANGLPDDVCFVDTRDDRVIIAPVPGTVERYAPFELPAKSGGPDGSTIAPMGCVPHDLDEDGWPDLLIYFWGRPPIAFMRRGGSPAEASELTPDSFSPQDIVGLAERWYTSAATFADIDGDGHADLVLGNYFQDGARVLDEAAADPVALQDSWSRASNGGRNRILLWAGLDDESSTRIRFVEAKGALDESATHAWTFAIGAADLDGDARPEIYFANDFGPDSLLHNRSRPGQVSLVALTGERAPTTPGSKVLGRDSFKGMGVDFADVNGDARLDILVSNIAAEFSLLESHFLFESTGDVERMWAGVAPFVDRSEARGLARGGWGWDVKFGDFDNDGEVEAVRATGFIKGDTDRWPELHELATANDALIGDPACWPRFGEGDDISGRQRNQFFVRDRTGRYSDLAPALGVDAQEVSRGVAMADVDGDGLLDFAVGSQWAPSFFYHNEAPAPGAFVGLRLLLPARGVAGDEIRITPGRGSQGGLGTPAIGATATLSLPDGRRRVGQVDGGNGHSGVRAPELHFGLGAWPEGQVIECALTWRDRGGQLRRQRVGLTPGWHTIVLDGGGEGV